MSAYTVIDIIPGFAADQSSLRQSACDRIRASSPHLMSLCRCDSDVPRLRAALISEPAI